MGVNDDKLFRKIATMILPLVMLGFFFSYQDWSASSTR